MDIIYMYYEHAMNAHHLYAHAMHKPMLRIFHRIKLLSGKWHCFNSKTFKFFPRGCGLLEGSNDTSELRASYPVHCWGRKDTPAMAWVQVYSNVCTLYEVRIQMLLLPQNAIFP